MPPSSSTTHLVLVADDEPSMLELVARHLKSHVNPKLDILEATDGEQAWHIARERLPDLVVLDVMMPGMSGWEVCRKIREDVALAHTSVVMLTGIGENLNQMTSPLYGADAYIDKPFDFDELDAKVELALQARAALRGSITRPPLNGVAGPAKVARGVVLRGGKKPAAKAKRPAKKPVAHASPKKVAKKSVKKAVLARKVTAKAGAGKRVSKAALPTKKTARTKAKPVVKTKKAAPKAAKTKRR
jgi:DNA-binding response OmpR family regulator